jgi:hypothetical protein
MAELSPRRPKRFLPFSSPSRPIPSPWRSYVSSRVHTLAPPHRVHPHRTEFYLASLAATRSSTNPSNPTFISEICPRTALLGSVLFARCSGAHPAPAIPVVIDSSGDGSGVNSEREVASGLWHDEESNGSVLDTTSFLISELFSP